MRRKDIVATHEAMRYTLPVELWESLPRISAVTVQNLAIAGFVVVDVADIAAALRPYETGDMEDLPVILSPMSAEDMAADIFNTIMRKVTP